MDTLGAPIGGKRVATGDSPRSRGSTSWSTRSRAAAAKVMVETPMIKLLQNDQQEVIGVLADSPKGLIRILAKSVVLATGGWHDQRPDDDGAHLPLLGHDAPAQRVVL